MRPILPLTEALSGPAGTLTAAFLCRSHRFARRNRSLGQHRSVTHPLGAAPECALCRRRGRRRMCDRVLFLQELRAFLASALQARSQMAQTRHAPHVQLAAQLLSLGQQAVKLASLVPMRPSWHRWRAHLVELGPHPRPQQQAATNARRWSLHTTHSQTDDALTITCHSYLHVRVQGTFNGSPGSPACTQCAAGTSSNASGASSCAPCGQVSILCALSCMTWIRNAD